MLIDIFSERGFHAVVDKHIQEIPERLDLATGDPFPPQGGLSHSHQFQGFGDPPRLSASPGTLAQAAGRGCGLFCCANQPLSPSHERSKEVAGDERCAAKRSTAKPRPVRSGTDVPTADRAIRAAPRGTLVRAACRGCGLFCCANQPLSPSHERSKEVAGDERCAAKRSTAKPRPVRSGTDVPTHLRHLGCASHPHHTRETAPPARAFIIEKIGQEAVDGALVVRRYF
jgi:hypothetical protein